MYLEYITFECVKIKHYLGMFSKVQICYKGHLIDSDRSKNDCEAE